MVKSSGELLLLIPKYRLGKPSNWNCRSREVAGIGLGGKIDRLPKRILVTHPKPQYYDIIRTEIERLGLKEIELLHDGTVFDI